MIRNHTLKLDTIQIMVLKNLLRTHIKEECKQLKDILLNVIKDKTKLYNYLSKIFEE